MADENDSTTLKDAFNAFVQKKEKRKRLLWANCGSKVAGILTATAGFPAAIMMGGLAPIGIASVGIGAAVVGAVGTMHLLKKNLKEMQDSRQEVESLAADDPGALARLNEEFGETCVVLENDVRPLKKLAFRPRR
jgi:hypothetical protein